MSERGQKIFQWCVWIVIILLFVIKIVSVAQSIKDSIELSDEHPISQNEWVIMLAEGFDNDDIMLSQEYSDEFLTGKYAALSSVMQ